jgi:hypothetical protein
MPPKRTGPVHALVQAKVFTLHLNTETFLRKKGQPKASLGIMDWGMTTPYFMLS